MMSTTALSAVLAAVIAAASQSALADSTTDYYGSTTENPPISPQPLTSTAPVIDPDDVPDIVDDSVQASGRNGSHSMHPAAPVKNDQFADDQSKAP